MAAQLHSYTGRENVVVLGLPRGGVPVARVVADALDVPMDVLVVRKIGCPGHEELAIGAIGPGDITVLDQSLMKRLGFSRDALEPTIARERGEMDRRELAYRGGRAFPELRGETVLLVDDGLATGATMVAAVAATRQMKAEHVVVAVPVASDDGVRRLEEVADEVIAVAVPRNFVAVGLWYQDFSPVTDTEVRDCLEN